MFVTFTPLDPSLYTVDCSGAICTQKSILITVMYSLVLYDRQQCLVFRERGWRDQHSLHKMMILNFFVGIHA